MRGRPTVLPVATVRGEAEPRVPRRRHRSSVCNRPSAASKIGGGAAGRCEMSALGTGTIECRLVSSHHDQRHRVARGRIRFGRALRHHPDQSRRQQRENRRYRWGTGFGASPPVRLAPCTLPIERRPGSNRFFQLLRRPERDLFAGGDLHHLACGRIASRARLALANL